jgi:hypothetical protein
MTSTNILTVVLKPGEERALADGECIKVLVENKGPGTIRRADGDEKEIGMGQISLFVGASLTLKNIDAKNNATVILDILSKSNQ